MTFDGPSWVFIGDTEICPFSKQQIEICKDLNLDLKGGILCNESENKDSDACKQVSSFPCFCNIHTKVCVPGLRDTIEEFYEMQKLSDKQK